MPLPPISTAPAEPAALPHGFAPLPFRLKRQRWQQRQSNDSLFKLFDFLTFYDFLKNGFASKMFKEFKAFVLRFKASSPDYIINLGCIEKNKNTHTKKHCGSCSFFQQQQQEVTRRSSTKPSTVLTYKKGNGSQNPIAKPLGDGPKLGLYVYSSRVWKPTRLAQPNNSKALDCPSKIGSPNEDL